MRASGNTVGYGVVTDMLEDVDIDEYDIIRKKERKAQRKAEEEAAGKLWRCAIVLCHVTTCMYEAVKLTVNAVEENVVSSVFCSWNTCQTET